MSTTQVTCFKHYCRACHAMEFVAVVKGGANDYYPQCCQRAMAYLGMVDAAPGRDESLKNLHDKPMGPMALAQPSTPRAIPPLHADQREAE